MTKPGKILLKWIVIPILLVLLCLWLFRPAPPYSGEIPYLKGDLRWPDSLSRTLSPAQKLAQLILYVPNFSASGMDSTVIEAAKAGNIGGIQCKNIPLLQYLLLLDQIQPKASIPVFSLADHQVLLNGQFSDGTHMPGAGVLAAQSDPKLVTELDARYIKQVIALGINLAVPFDLNQPWRDTTHQKDLIHSLLQNRIIPAAKGLPAYLSELPDTSSQLRAHLRPLKRLVEEGLGAVLIDQPIAGTEDIDPFPRNFYKNYLRRNTGFEGLIIGAVTKDTPLNYLLKLGVDLFLTEQTPEVFATRLESARSRGLWEQQDIRSSLFKTLLAKQWMYGSTVSTAPAAHYSPLDTEPIKQRKRQDYHNRNLDAIWRHFKEADWNSYVFKLRARALVIPSNPKLLLPWRDLTNNTFYLWKTGRSNYSTLEKGLKKHTILPPYSPSSKVVSPGSVLVLLDDQSPRINSDSLFRSRLIALNKQHALVIFNFGAPQLLQGLDTTFTIIQTFEKHPHTEALAVALFLGGVAPQGRWNDPSKGILPGAIPNATPKIRLNDTETTFNFLQTSRFKQIDALARLAINRGYMPGCQVLVAHKGDILYQKNYGYHTTVASAAVRDTDVYDLASLTKIASTTVLAMRFWEEGKIMLNDPISRHIPWLRGTRIGRIPIWKLLSHQSGLPAAIPVNKYIKYRKYSKRACDVYFCTKNRGSYTVPVAQGLYFNRRYQAEIRSVVAQIRPVISRGYKYSDLNFWLLQQVLESAGGKPLDQLSQEWLYQPLGMRHTHFRPTKYFPLEQIIPTERDKVWRRQLLHGHVHDPAAAVLGGVSGHAGLFSNAEDMAVLMYALLNQGSYGHVKLFEPETITRFTQSRIGHRSLGFDHPSAENRFKRVEEASAQTFGHTGYTGGCIWVDPKAELIFIFLSNRVYPSAKQRGLVHERIRERMMKSVYEALLKPDQPTLPEL